MILKKQAETFATPIMVIGNISVGGNGKTPVIIALAQALTAKGYRIGIVSRGYMGVSKQYPLVCYYNSDPASCGDEPVLIAQETQLPVVVDPKRPRAIKYLESMGQFDLILSDDGLQHYRMSRDFEIAVVGSKLALGNLRQLPSGPLREPLNRLHEVDWVLGDVNFPDVDFKLKMHVVGFYRLGQDALIPLSYFKDKPLMVVTGIALPQRVYTTLESLGLKFEKKAFPDHHKFNQSDFTGMAEQQIIMTAKDAVKCSNLDLKNAFYIKISIELDEQLIVEIENKLSTRGNS